MSAIHIERLAQVTRLSYGSHSPGPKMCLLEAVAFVAGEHWSAFPLRVSPVLAAFGRTWNDHLRSNRQRKQLLQYIPLLIGTANPDLELPRSYLALDWLVRNNIVDWLRLANLHYYADVLAQRPQIHSPESLQAILPQLAAARPAAKNATGDVDTPMALARTLVPAAVAVTSAAMAAALVAAEPLPASCEATPYEVKTLIWSTTTTAAGAAAKTADIAVIKSWGKSCQAEAHQLYQAMIGIGA